MSDRHPYLSLAGADVLISVEPPRQSVQPTPVEQPPRKVEPESFVLYGS
jgi:hypothetical protein